MHSFWLFLLPKLEHLGHWNYWIILLISMLESTAFIGLFIPGTAIIVFAGFLASQKIMDVGDLVWFVALGGIIGDSVSFFLGKKGVDLFTVENKFLKKSYLEIGEQFFAKHGNKSILLARFIGPLRPVVPFVAGLSKMPSRKFLVYNIISGFIAAVFYILIGYFFGHLWYAAIKTIKYVQAAAIIIIVVLIIGYLLRRYLFKKKI